MAITLVSYLYTHLSKATSTYTIKRAEHVSYTTKDTIQRP